MYVFVYLLYAALPIASALRVLLIFVHDTPVLQPQLHPTYPLGAGAELKGDAVVGLREIYIALARFIIVSALLYCRGLSAYFSGKARS